MHYLREKLVNDALKRQNVCDTRHELTELQLLLLYVVVGVDSAQRCNDTTYAFHHGRIVITRQLHTATTTSYQLKAKFHYAS